VTKNCGSVNLTFRWDSGRCLCTHRDAGEATFQVSLPNKASPTAKYFCSARKGPIKKTPRIRARVLIGHDSEAVHELYVLIGREALQKAKAALPEI
jgi:hypothetical protein